MFFDIRRFKIIIKVLCRSYIAVFSIFITTFDHNNMLKRRFTIAIKHKVTLIMLFKILYPDPIGNFAIFKNLSKIADTVCAKNHYYIYDRY